MIPRDQRAVTMRCTATNITPAEAIVVKKSQLTRKACQARDSPVAAPKAKRPRPNTASPSATFFRPAGIALVFSTPTS